MPEQQVYHIHPLGWENDPDEERYRVSPLDFVGTCVFNNYTLYFKLGDEEKAKVLEVLRCGLERTLSQTRHLTSTIEQGPDGDHWFVRRYGNTVELRAQWLDSPEDADKYPSLQDMEDSHFSALTLGDLDLWRIPHMRCGADNPVAYPNLRPAVAAFKASFVRGGLVLVTHMYHLANDLSGWASFVQQLADNCRASLTGTPYPPWDPACLVVTRRLAKPPIPEADKVDPPKQTLLNDPSATPPLPGGRQSLLFHLPKSKAAQLKALCQPPSATTQTTSTAHPSIYAATTALLLHTLTRLRHPHYAAHIPRTARPLWAEVIDMRRRAARSDFGLGVIPQRMQRNLLSAAVSRLEMPGVGEGPTVGGLLGVSNRSALRGVGEREKKGGGEEGVEEEVWPLHRTAAWVRAMTEAAGTRAVLEGLHDQFHVLRDKTRAAADLHDLPALAVAVSDHRGAAAVIGGGGGRDGEGEGAEFGFGKPVAYRQLWGRVDVGLVIVYPARAGRLGEEGGEDEGLEFMIGYEKVLAKELVEDEEFGKWFEYRGVDWEEE
ncbi:hypothetical protein F5144DRAFT_599413 [Chaetomium tenue]|uniref:Uncharacterized protein n=1 Tax=Chaetomium tenue TaxID=1854479 RepID=A0ACB7PLU1_9PEZI|nr:hypothetical protein F5144DRAFT_599413 [Chaetomium globosum]